MFASFDCYPYGFYGAEFGKFGSFPILRRIFEGVPAKSQRPRTPPPIGGGGSYISIFILV